METIEQQSKNDRAKKPVIYLPKTNSAAFAKSIRAKCLDCAENAANVRDCTICKCPLWGLRFGKSPVAAQAYYERCGFEVVTVDAKKYDYIEQLKGKGKSKRVKN